MDTWLRVRRGDVRTLKLSEATFDDLAGATPWRDFRWHKGQVHYPGKYWSSTMGSHVGYESRLELAALMLADFDPRVRWISSQPFEMEAEVDGVRRRHVPDYLIERHDHSLCVVDVKPRRFLLHPEVAQALAWPAERFAERGWQYRISSEPEAIQFTNIRFLAGYRRAAQFADFDLGAVLQEVRGSVTLGGAFRAATVVVGDASIARAVVLHLLWSRRLACELNAAPLNVDTPVVHW